MWYSGNIAIDSIGVDFLPEQYDFDQTDVGSFINSVKEQNKLPFDYYKEILSNYRNLIYELDIERIQEYAESFPRHKMISQALQAEVF